MAKQVLHGKAFEYACARTLADFINGSPKSELNASLVASSPLETARQDFDTLSPKHQEILLGAGKALSEILEDTEPRLLYKAPGLADTVELSLQPDSQGIKGDVRDVLAVRIAMTNNDGWEIGISSKHNHDAVKHPRISPTIDIGQKWMGCPCDKTYWDDVLSVFDSITPFVGSVKWADLPDKEEKVYVPLLNAVKDQIHRFAQTNEAECATKLLHYLIGRDDFYKAIVIPHERRLEVQGFNLNGTLSQPAAKKHPLTKVAQLRLPTKIYKVHFVEGLNNTIRIVMDEGWQVSMRIHNASTMAEKSLKMDVRLEGIPPYVFTQTKGF